MALSTSSIEGPAVKLICWLCIIVDNTTKFELRGGMRQDDELDRWRRKVMESRQRAAEVRAWWW